MRDETCTNLTLSVAVLAVLTGCGVSKSEDSTSSRPVERRSVREVKVETGRVSSQVLEIISVKGKVSEPGPESSECAGKTEDKFFKVRHPWSLTRSSDEELKEAMVRLKSELPKKGWEISEDGRNSSRAKSPELTANHMKKKYAVNVEHWERDSGGDKNPPMLVVTVVSACYEVAE